MRRSLCLFLALSSASLAYDSIYNHIDLAIKNNPSNLTKSYGDFFNNKRVNHRKNQMNVLIAEYKKLYENERKKALLDQCAEQMISGGGGLDKETNPGFCLDYINLEE